MSDEETIFNEALSKASAQERSAFLDDACGGSAELRARVEVLLSAHECAGSFLESPPTGAIDANADTAVEQPLAEGPGTVVGVYKLLEQIGEGGMGVVFMAEQLHPVRRRVALKIIKPGLDTKQVIARFEAERQALAMMDHPNIAKVLEAGATEAGRPYFVMELVKGIPITEYCDQQKLSPRQRLDLFVQVCHAVQHAHQKGIIHRDLKPNNVLVTLQDGKPAPKVIDFGIAKATAGQRLTEQTLFTEFRQLVGTPLYMSPEQAEMSALMDMDTRSDVYSLGVLLYELLTGTTPFDKQRLAKAAYDEVRRIIREEEPPRPSTRISTLGDTLPSVSAQRDTDPKKLSGLLRGELDWIVMRAMEKDRTRRYGTASGLAEDVERYLADQPVEACPPSRVYRIHKMVRRNKTAITTAALLCIVLPLATGVSTWQAVRAKKAASVAVVQKQRADDQAARAESEAARAEIEAKRARSEAAKQQAINRFFNDMLSRADPRGPTTGPAAAARIRGRTVTVFDVLNEAVRKLDAGSMKDHPEIEAELRMTIANVYRSLNDGGPTIEQARIAVRLNQQVYGVESIQAERSMLRLGDLLAMIGSKEAEPIVRQVLAAQRRRGKVDTNILFKLAGALIPTQRLAEAEQLYREGLAMGAPLDPKNALGFMQILQRVDKLPEAETVGQTFIEGIRSDPAKDDEGLAIDLGSFADVLREEGKLDEADEALREATALHQKMLGKPPFVPSYWSALERLREAQGREADAEEVCRQRIAAFQSRAPANTLILTVVENTCLYGSVLYDHHKYAQSEAVLRKLLFDWRMGAPEAHEWPQEIVAVLTWDLEEQGNKTAAAAVWREAEERLQIELANSKSPAEAAKIALYLVSPLMHLGQKEDAKAMARQGMELEDREVLNGAAWGLAATNRKVMDDHESAALAVELATRALAMDPDDPHVLNTRGLACYRAGDFAASVEHLEKCIAVKGGGNSEDLFFLAMALERQGHDHDAAVSSWNKAVKIMDRNVPKSAELLSWRKEAAEVLGLPN